MKYNTRCMPRLKPIFFCGHWQGTPLGAMGGASLRRCCAPHARDAQQWPPTARPRLGPAAAASLNKYTARPARGSAAQHPAIGAGGRTAARRVRMMKLSKPPASPPRRTAAAGADTCARAAEAAREGGRGPRGRHPESGPGGHAGMWIGEGAGGGGAWMHLQNHFGSIRIQDLALEVRF